MKKFYVSSTGVLNEEEKRTGYISYGNLIDRYINNKIICNAITKDDAFMEEFYSIYWDEENESSTEVFQWYLTDCGEYDKDVLKSFGIELVYNYSMDLYVLPVFHYGTSWYYVMTDVKWSTNWEECRK